MPELPIDEELRMGVLDNGLTYMIRYNNWPENRANFYIAQKVGSLQEEDSQRGLAHFLEHMCFNGTDNFEGNAVIEYCRSIGVEFGRDLNAYTSIEETVYNIDNVPTQNQAALDSCLLILRDWADGLILDPEEIDKERGVIHEEWRLRTSASSRMLERNLPALYPNSKYGERYPIGTMAVIDNFKPKELRDYYEKWYHPSNQGIIVVGNVDVDYTEAKIKELFGGMTNPANQAAIEWVEVPNNEEAIIIIDKDKEYTLSDIDFFLKHDAFPKEQKNTVGYLVNNYIVDAALNMLHHRLEDVVLNPDCPFLNASCSDGEYILSKSKDAFNLSLYPKTPEQSAEALTAALLEVKRAAQYGFTETEYARFKDSFQSALDKRYLNKDKRTNAQFYRQCKAHFLDNEPLMSIDNEYEFYSQIIPMIPLEVVNEVMNSLNFDTDENIVVVNFNNEADDAVYPTRDELLGAIHTARQTELESYVDEVRDEPLIAELPTPGTIVSESYNALFDYTELELSNGVTVILKQTDHKKDQVLLYGQGGAGETLYPADDANLQVFDNVIDTSGLGNFSASELKKALAGKIANASLSMRQQEMFLKGNATPKDVETMLQLTYLYFTNINKDQAAYDNLISIINMELKNRDLSPNVALSDSITATFYGHNPRLAPMTSERLATVDYDRILQIAKERTANARGWEFTIIGNYDAETIRPLVCQYLGSLPADAVAEQYSPRDKYLAKGIVDNVFKRKQETPKATAIIAWHNDQLPYSVERDVQIDMLGQILSMEYLKKIREEASAAYSVGASGAVQHDNDGYTLHVLQAYCPMKPEKQDVAMEILYAEAERATQSIDEEELAEIKELMIKNYEDNQHENPYWVSVINEWRKHGIDCNTPLPEIIATQSTDKLREAMRELLSAGNCITVVMLPEED